MGERTAQDSFELGLRLAALLELPSAPLDLRRKQERHSAKTPPGAFVRAMHRVAVVRRGCENDRR